MPDNSAQQKAKQKKALPVRTENAVQMQKTIQSTQTRYRTSADWLVEADGERRLGHFELALRYYGRALEMDRTMVSCWVGQAQMLLYLNEERQAEIWAVNGLKIFPQNGDLLACRALAFTLLGCKKQALEYTDASIQAEGASAWRWLVRGEIMLQRKSNSAEYCMQTAINLDPDWLIKIEIARIYFWHKQTYTAAKYIERALKEAPDVPYIWLIKGVCLRMQGNYPGARTALTRAMEIFPGYEEAMDELTRTPVSFGFFRRFFRFLFRR